MYQKEIIEDIKAVAQETGLPLLVVERMVRYTFMGVKEVMSVGKKDMPPTFKHVKIRNFIEFRANKYLIANANRLKEWRRRTGYDEYVKRMREEKIANAGKDIEEYHE